MAKKKKTQFKKNLKKRIPQEKGGDLLGAKAEETRSLRERGWPAGPVQPVSGLVRGLHLNSHRAGRVKVKITPAAAKRRKATDALVNRNKWGVIPGEKAKRVAAFKANAAKTRAAKAAKATKKVTKKVKKKGKK